MMPKIDIENLPERTGSSYPAPFASAVDGRSRRKLGDAAGLTQYGVNLTTLEPGAMSALRHWHEYEDEFVWIVSGEVVLIEDEGEVTLRPGDAAGFKAGVANGHHLVNRSAAPATYLEIGTRADVERGHYPDDDLAYAKDGRDFRFTRKDGRDFD
jgi:uncharacterized cupin superfamily protein